MSNTKILNEKQLILYQKGKIWKQSFKNPIKENNLIMNNKNKNLENNFLKCLHIYWKTTTTTTQDWKNNRIEDPIYRQITNILNWTLKTQLEKNNQTHMQK